MGAYKFDGIDDQAIYVGTSPVTAYPVTIGIVFMADTSLAAASMAGLYNSTDDSRYVIIQYVAADDVTHRVASGSSGNSCASLGAGADDVWQTGAAVGVSSTSRAVFRAGANKGTTTTTRTWPTGLNKIGVGRFTAIAPGEPLAGWIAYVFIWNVALSDAEVANFHAGTIPQSSALVAAYDFTTDQGSTIVDQIGTRDLTVTGAFYDASVTPSPTFSFGPETLYGATSMGITFGKAVVGQRKTFGQIDRPFTFASVISGKVTQTHFGSLALPIAFGAVIDGRRKTFGQLAFPVIFSKDVSGQRKTFSQIALPINVSIATAGNRLAKTLYGIVALPIAFGTTVDGRRKSFGQLTFPISFLKEVQAQRTTFGQLLSPLIFGASVQGQRKTFGQVMMPITAAISTAGIRMGLRLYGSLSLPMTFGKDVRGQRKAFGQIAMPLTFAKNVVGQRKTFSQISFPIIFTKEAVGRKNVFGALSMQTLFGKEIAGRRKTFSQLALPVTFSKAVSGQRKTFGQIALPINATIVISGKVIHNLFGSIAMPLTFGKQVAARRKTFGQITAPFLFGSASQGRRQTFSGIELPIDFTTVVKSGPVGTHGVLKLELILTTDVDGHVRVFGVILNDALNLYLGNQNVVAAYVGSEQVWP